MASKEVLKVGATRKGSQRSHAKSWKSQTTRIRLTTGRLSTINLTSRCLTPSPICIRWPTRRVRVGRAVKPASKKTSTISRWQSAFTHVMSSKWVLRACSEIKMGGKASDRLGTSLKSVCRPHRQILRRWIASLLSGSQREASSSNTALSRSAKSRKRARNMPSSPRLCLLIATLWSSHLPMSPLVTDNQVSRAYLSSTATSRRSIWNRRRFSRRCQCKLRTVAR